MCKTPFSLFSADIILMFSVQTPRQLSRQRGSGRAAYSDRACACYVRVCIMPAQRADACCRRRLRKKVWKSGKISFISKPPCYADWVYHHIACILPSCATPVILFFNYFRLYFDRHCGNISGKDQVCIIIVRPSWRTADIGLAHLRAAAKSIARSVQRQ